MLLTRLGELIREFAIGALSSQKGNQQSARDDEERKITKYVKNVHSVPETLW
jgi:hypothetical protein